MRKHYILLGFIGYFFSIILFPILCLEKHYFLGTISLILGIAVIDYNRGGLK
jgi:hypothetical protein